MRLSLSRRRGASALPAALVALTGTMLASPAVHAQTISSFYGDATISTGYSSDPFLFGNGETSSGYAEITLSPRYVLADPEGQLSVAATIRRTEYFSNNEPAEAFALSTGLSRRLSPRTSMSASLSFNSSIQGERSSFAAPVPNAPVPLPEPEPDPFDPDPGVDPGLGLDPDVSLIGQRVRRNFYGGSANLSTQLTELDSLSVGVSVNRSDYGSDVGIDYWTYGSSASYSRTLSARTQVGASVSIQKTSYTGLFPNSTSYSPQLTFNTRFSPEFTLNASAGVVIIDSEDPSGLRDSSGLAGTLRGCYASGAQSLCFSAVRDASATGFGETSQRTSFDMNYTYSLSQADSIRVNAYYSHVDTEQVDFAGLVPLTNEYYTTSVAWDRRIGTRIYLGASVSYRSTSYFESSSEDVSGQVTLRYNLGRIG
jgi:hypothetical protein